MHATSVGICKDLCHVCRERPHFYRDRSWLHRCGVGLIHQVHCAFNRFSFLGSLRGGMAQARIPAPGLSPLEAAILGPCWKHCRLQWWLPLRGALHWLLAASLQARIGILQLLCHFEALVEVRHIPF